MTHEEAKAKAAENGEWPFDHEVAGVFTQEEDCADHPPDWCPLRVAPIRVRLVAAR